MENKEDQGHLQMPRSSSETSQELATPVAPQGHEDGTAPSDAEGANQSVAMTTAQAAVALGVDTRTVRRYITDGIRGPQGVVMKLPARQVRTKSGHEWQIQQGDLEAFMAVRDSQATEGEASSHLIRQEPASQGIAMAAIQMISTELERRGVEMESQHAVLREAHETIERLATERGRLEGQNELLLRENEALRQRLAELEGPKSEPSQRRGRIWPLRNQ